MRINENDEKCLYEMGWASDELFVTRFNSAEVIYLVEHNLWNNWLFLLINAKYIRLGLDFEAWVFFLY